MSLERKGREYDIKRRELSLKGKMYRIVDFRIVNVLEEL